MASSDRTSPDPSLGPEASIRPAPYGESCDGCAKAKSKCYYRASGATCERCARLCIECRPAPSVRRTRRRPRVLSSPQRAPPPQPLSTNGIEQRLDTLISLLHSQAVERSHSSQTSNESPASQKPERLALDPANLTSTPNPASNDGSRTTPPSRTALPHYGFGPDIEIDANTHAVHFPNPEPTDDPILRAVLSDVSVHRIPATEAQAQLNMFRESFLPMFPLVHIPAEMTSSELQQTKPLLWLVIMTLTCRNVPQQLAMGDTLWHVISKRVVSEHLINMDLLLGTTCMSAWSHYFKKQRPFFIMLAQIASSLAFELNLHKDMSVILPKKMPAGQLINAPHLRPRQKTTEERRAILSVAHVSFTIWMIFKKSDPLRWTAYMDTCAQILSQGSGSPLDPLLVFLVRCDNIIRQVSFPGFEMPADLPNGAAPPPASVVSALVGQLYGHYRSLPDHVQLQKVSQLYLLSTEVRLKGTTLDLRKAPPASDTVTIRRLQELESTLATAERWFSIFNSLTSIEILAMSSPVFLQWLTTLTVVFRLTVVRLEGWDTAEVRRRIDLANTIDTMIYKFGSLQAQLGIVDGDSENDTWVITKLVKMMQSLRPMLVAEKAPPASDGGSWQAQVRTNALNETMDTTDPSAVPAADDGFGSGSLDDFMFTDSYLASVAEEPWMLDLIISPWEADSGAMDGISRGNFNGIL